MLLSGACIHTSGAQGVALAMYPMDGSAAANPATTISFRDGPDRDSDDHDELHDLRITGSVSGRIDGDLTPHPDGQA